MSLHTGSFSQCALETAASQIELRLISWLEDVQHHLVFSSMPHPFNEFSSSNHGGSEFKVLLPMVVYMQIQPA
ncbi:unnamed protein product, partial [Staurois parvus]